MWQQYEIGVVNNADIYSEPDITSEIIYVIKESSEVLVDMLESTNMFFKIVTAFGAEGFCLRNFVTLKFS